MRINKIVWNKLKTQWELSKMKAAYIAAEKAIVQDASLTGWEQPKQDLDKFARSEMDEFGHVTNFTVRDVQIKTLEGQLKELEEVGRRLLEEEKYELLKESKEIWEKINQQLNNLKLR